VDEVKATTGIDIKAVTADAGYSYAKVYGALERRDIDALIPTKAGPIRSPVPLRRFRNDAKKDSGLRFFCAGSSPAPLAFLRSGRGAGFT
jgi:hypothetical protein